MLKLKPISLAKSPQYTEAWVQDQIAENPALIGLGDLILKDKERIQKSGGRLDLLLQDPDTLKRFEVELQLGALDESHLIRTIEYWDIERKRYPQYDHCAVIIAEDITSRFLNVVQLFNGHIPLIAIKMTAYEVNGEIGLTFVKVVGEQQFGLVDEDEEVAEKSDRPYWEKKSSTQTLKIIDNYAKMIQQVEPGYELNYNKVYIGLQKNGTSNNFVYFNPRKSSTNMVIKFPKTTEYDEKLDDLDFDLLSPEKRNNYYRIKLDGKESSEQIELLTALIQKARDNCI